MTKEEEMTEFHKAFVAMQAALPAVKKTAENPAFKRAGSATKYADLGTIVETVRPVLTEHGFGFTQEPSCLPDGTPTLVTELIHEAGTRRSEMPLPPAKNAQELGSALTYCRRYALSAVLGIVTEDDDDGNAASQQRPQSRPASSPRPRPAPNGNGEMSPREVRDALIAAGLDPSGSIGDMRQRLAAHLAGANPQTGEIKLDDYSEEPF